MWALGQKKSAVAPDSGVGQSVGIEAPTGNVVQTGNVAQIAGIEAQIAGIEALDSAGHIEREVDRNAARWPDRNKQEMQTESLASQKH